MRQRGGGGEELGGEEAGEIAVGHKIILIKTPFFFDNLIYYTKYSDYSPSFPFFPPCSSATSTSTGPVSIFMCFCFVL